MARQIAELIQQGNSKQAGALMQEFETAREQLFKSLDELYLS